MAASSRRHTSSASTKWHVNSGFRLRNGMQYGKSMNIYSEMFREELPGAGV